VPAIIFAVLTVLVFALVGTVYPALRIRRIRVMDALHFS
jgi:ABC-type antimicrobial peptide transport system permease subunit